MMSKVCMHYVRYGARGEHYYESVEDALRSAITHIEHELSVPLDICVDGKIVYDEETIRGKWNDWAEEH